MTCDCVRRCVECGWKLVLSMELADPDNELCNDCKEDKANEKR